jgi:cytochrome b561
VTQYSKRMVIIHWLTLALLIVAWYLGTSSADATDDSKATLAGYIWHISAGADVSSSGQGCSLLALYRAFFVASERDNHPFHQQDGFGVTRWRCEFAAQRRWL